MSTSFGARRRPGDKTRRSRDCSTGSPRNPGSPTFPLVRLVGRYEILSPLGQGGMATVYLARQGELERLVALKELQVLRGSDPSFAKRFLREARMAGSLSHPNIVTVHDYFEADGVPFIAMEYMERGSLRPYIGQMSLAQVGGVLQSLLAGLQYAGERGIVHRDLKPENLMVSGEGSLKIADFGIAKARNAFQTGGALTADGTALGTPNYMAPEQALAEEVGTWTDIYAVGVIAFEIFVGRTPFADTPQPLVVIMRQVQDPIPLVTDLDPTIDPRIAGWIAWLTAKEPSARPQSAAEAWDAFEEILISILGPRWQRGARLLALGAAAGAGAAIPGPATPPPFGAATGPLTQRSLDVPTEPLTERPDPGQEPTVMPNPDILGIDRTLAAEGAERTRSPRRKRLVLALVAAGVLAAAAIAAAARGGPSHSPASSAKPGAPAAAAKPAKAGAPAAAATPTATQPATAQPAGTPVATKPGRQDASAPSASGSLASKGR